MRMPTLVAVGFAAALLLVAAVTPATAAPEVGKAAPDFMGVDSNGKSHKLSDLKGKIVVLEWTNHDCPYVRKHYDTGNMQKTQKHVGDGGALWLTILSSAPGEQGHVTPAKANELTQTRKATPTAVLHDPEGRIGRAYDAGVTPHMVVVDKDGTLKYMGAMDDKPTTRRDDVATATNFAWAAFDAVQSGKAVDPASTRAYGCTIKYAPAPRS